MSFIGTSQLLLLNQAIKLKQTVTGHCELALGRNENYDYDSKIKHLGQRSQVLWLHCQPFSFYETNAVCSKINRSVDQRK